MMMNGMEKSTRLKSANKGTSVPAESMERRTEPKGIRKAKACAGHSTGKAWADRIRQFVGASDGASVTVDA